MGLISRVSSRTYRFIYLNNKMSTSISTRKYMTNRLLNRKQMIVDIHHGDKATPSRKTIGEQLAKMYKSTPDCVVVYGVNTNYGGGKSVGFANIYDSLDFLKKNAPRHHQIKLGHADKVEKKARQQRKQLKNRRKKVKGIKKTKLVPLRSKLIWNLIIFY